jgi:hypothetical protein
MAWLQLRAWLEDVSEALQRTHASQRSMACTGAGPPQQAAAAVLVVLQCSLTIGCRVA